MGESEQAAHGAALARNLLRRLRFSNTDTDRITHLIAQHRPLPPLDASDAVLRRWLRGVGPAFLYDLLRLDFAVAQASDASLPERRALARFGRRTAAILAARPALSVADLAIGGKDLNRLGIAPGPRYGEILDALLERVLDDPSLNDPDVLLRIAGEVTESLRASDRPVDD